jgi:hypothetical protein
VGEFEEKVQVGLASDVVSAGGGKIAVTLAENGDERKAVEKVTAAAGTGK